MLCVERTSDFDVETVPQRFARLLGLVLDSNRPPKLGLTREGELAQIGEPPADDDFDAGDKRRFGARLRFRREIQAGPFQPDPLHDIDLGLRGLLVDQAGLGFDFGPRSRLHRGFSSGPSLDPDRQLESDRNRHLADEDHEPPARGPERLPRQLALVRAFGPQPDGGFDAPIHPDGGLVQAHAKATGLFPVEVDVRLQPGVDPRLQLDPAGRLAPERLLQVPTELTRRRLGFVDEPRWGDPGAFGHSFGHGGEAVEIVLFDPVVGDGVEERGWLGGNSGQAAHRPDLLDLEQESFGRMRVCGFPVRNRGHEVAGVQPEISFEDEARIGLGRQAHDRRGGNLDDPRRFISVFVVEKGVAAEGECCAGKADSQVSTGQLQSGSLGRVPGLFCAEASHERATSLGGPPQIAQVSAKKSAPRVKSSTWMPRRESGPPSRRRLGSRCPPTKPVEPASCAAPSTRKSVYPPDDLKFGGLSTIRMYGVAASPAIADEVRIKRHQRPECDPASTTGSSSLTHP